jgi:hypothetical protein
MKRIKKRSTKYVRHVFGFGGLQRLLQLPNGLVGLGQRSVLHSHFNKRNGKRKRKRNALHLIMVVVMLVRRRRRRGRGSGRRRRGRRGSGGSGGWLVLGGFVFGEAGLKVIVFVGQLALVPSHVVQFPLFPRQTLGYRSQLPLRIFAFPGIIIF